MRMLRNSPFNRVFMRADLLRGGHVKSPLVDLMVLPFGCASCPRLGLGCVFPVVHCPLL